MRIHPTINSGKIKEYPVNVKLEHKNYALIYNILLAIDKGDLDTIEYYMSDSFIKNNNVDWTKIKNEFWNNKDKDIVD